MKTTFFNGLLFASALALLPACVSPANRTAPPQAYIIDATLRTPLSTPAAIHAGNEVMTGAYQPVAILYSPCFSFSASKSSASLLAAKAASLGADAVIGFRAQAWELYPLGLSVRRMADSDTLKLVDCRPMVVEIETIHWTGEKPWGEARTLEPELYSRRYSQIALALAEKGYFAYAKNARSSRDGTNKPDPSYLGQMPGLRPDYTLRVAVLDNHLLFFVLGAKRKYSVRVDLVSWTTGAVEQSAVGTGEYTVVMQLPDVDPYPAAMARAVSNAIAQMRENR